MRRTLATLTGALFLLSLGAAPALATNGMNMIGYNVRSSGMGGADAAIDSDCSGSACNPATLGRLRPRSAAIGLSLLMPQLNLKNEFSPLGANDIDGDSQIFPLPYVAYAQRLGPESPWTLGFDLFAQGGMGVSFDDVKTFAGTTDKVESQVRYMRFSPTAAYRVNDTLSLGATVMVGYADMAFSLFPGTYSMGMDMTPGTADDFPGMKAEGLSSFGMAGRIGAHYKVSETVSLGASYTTPTALALDNGDLTLNFGMAKAKYDAKMEDFTWPQEAEAGVAVQATPQLLLAADIKWIGWSSAIDKVKLVASNPPAGFPDIPDIVFNMNWDDQWVYAVGAEYAVTPQHAVRVGYNYGKSPVPDANLSPLFPAIVEHHVTLGYGYTSEHWGFDAAYEHAFKNTQTNDNPNPAENPFGAGVEVSHSQNTVHAAVSYYY